MNRGKKIFLISTVVILTILISGFLYIYSSYGSIFEKAKNEISEKDDDSKEEMPDYKEIEGITNILLVGTDDRNEDEESVRADTIMILTIDDIHKKIKLTSVMRDSYVDIPNYSPQKINHSFAYGGIDLLMATIEKNFNIKLDKYIRINFDGFKDLVNTIDGIEVDLSNEEEVNELNRCILLEMYENPNMKDSKIRNIIDKGRLLVPRDEGARYLIKNNPRITKSEYNYLVENAQLVEEKNKVHLNGIQALAYSRMRHSTNGSYGRVHRQREVVNLIINKLKDTSLIKYPFIGNKIMPFVKTNIPFSEALNLAYTVYNINNYDMEQLQVPPNKLSQGRIYKNKGYVFLMDKENTTKVMHDFIFEDIAYDEDNYPQFIYSKSEYYYVVEKPIEKPSDKDKDKDKEDNKDTDESENEDKEDNEGTDESENEDKEDNEGTDESGNGDKEDNEGTDESENGDKEDNEGTDESGNVEQEGNEGAGESGDEAQQNNQSTDKSEQVDKNDSVKIENEKEVNKIKKEIDEIINLT